MPQCGAQGRTPGDEGRATIARNHAAKKRANLSHPRLGQTRPSRNFEERSLLTLSEAC